MQLKQFCLFVCLFTTILSFWSTPGDTFDTNVTYIVCVLVVCLFLLGLVVVKISNIIQWGVFYLYFIELVTVCVFLQSYHQGQI